MKLVANVRRELQKKHKAIMNSISSCADKVDKKIKFKRKNPADEDSIKPYLSLNYRCMASQYCR